MQMICNKCNRAVEVNVIEEKLNRNTSVVSIVCSNCDNKTIAYYLNDKARDLQKDIRISEGDKRISLQKELKEVMDKLKKENE